MIIFDSRPSPERHPDRLRVLAKLRGVSAPQFSTAKVLDLGCGTGIDLIAWALQAPQAQFTGIDLNAEFIALGNKLITELNIKNLTLLCEDICEYKVKKNAWDYIICHGVYAWVPKNVQRNILQIMQTGLNDLGLAYLSFNVLPGWETRRSIQKIINVYDDPSQSAEVRVEQAINSLNKAKLALSDSASLQAQLLLQEVTACLRQSGAFIYHELLNQHSEAVYLDEFVKILTEYNLEYLGEGDPKKMHLAALTEGSRELWQKLDVVSSDVVKANQLLDLFSQNSLRGAILTKTGKSFAVTPEYSNIMDMYVSSGLKAVADKVNLDSPATEAYQGPHESIIEINSSGVKQILNHLSKVWANAVPVKELLSVPNETADFGNKNLMQWLGEYFLQGLIDLYCEPPLLAKKVSETPEVYQLTRSQANLGFAWVTNLRFEFLPITEFDRHLLPIMDGKSDLAILVNKLLELIKSGKVEIQIDQGYSEQDLAELLKTQVQACLDHYFEVGLLVN